jgi:hypothetical protein
LAVYQEFESLKFNSNLYTSVGTPEDSNVAEEPNFLVQKMAGALKERTTSRMSTLKQNNIATEEIND